METSRVAGKQKAVSVIVRWCGRIIDEKTAEGIESLTLGSGREADFVVPEELGAGENFCVVEPAGDRWVVNVPQGWAARVFSGSGEEAGLQRRGQRSIFIGVTERVLLSRGPVEIDIAWAAPKRAIRPAISRMLDRVFAGWLVLAGGFLVSIVWVAVAVIKDVPAAHESGVVKQHISYIHKIMKTVEKKPVPVDKKAIFKDVTIESNLKPQKADPTSAATRPLRKPMSREEQVRLVKSKGLIGIIVSGGGFSDKIFNPGLGPGVNEALSGMTGPSYASAGPGLGGIGGSRGGDGGPVPLVGVGGPGPGGGRRVHDAKVAIDGGKRIETPVLPGTIVLQGGLEKEVVARVIQRHWNQVKHCYDKGLQKDPGLQGKVVLQFVISGTGRVSQSRIAETLMNSAEVEDCLRSIVVRWFFPEPKGGGEVLVTYPFIFTAAGGG